MKTFQKFWKMILLFHFKRFAILRKIWLFGYAEKTAWLEREG